MHGRLTAGVIGLWRGGTVRTADGVDCFKEIKMAGTNISGKKKNRWAAGVTPYAEMGYYDADYEPKDTDILCAFRLVPHDSVEPIEAAAAVGSTLSRSEEHTSNSSHLGI